MFNVIFIKITPPTCNPNINYIFSHAKKKTNHNQDKAEYNCQISVRSCDRNFSKLSSYYFEF